MHSFDLVTAPWIPVLSASGVRDVGLADAFSEDIAALATGDSYEDVALLRLMIAIAVAADAESLHPAQWVRNHTGDFDLFHPQRPFAQNADMLRFIDAGKTNPIADLSYRHGGTGKAAANMFHSHSGITLTPAETARQLVVRQCFSVPGIQPFLGNLFPAQKHPGTGKMETVLPSIAAEGTAGTLAWIEDGDLPSTLAANVAAVRGRPLGTFHFTWTHGHPPVYLHPEGVLDGLTYLARSIYVEPGTEVTRAMVCNGVRWPADKDKLGYTEDMDPELKPFALYLISSEEHNAAKRATERIVKAAKAGKKAKPVAPKTFPRRNYSSSMGRTAWRTLLRGLVDQQPPSAVLSAARPGQTLRTAGIGTSNQSRIDGLFVASLPAPAEGSTPRRSTPRWSTTSRVTSRWWPCRATCAAAPQPSNQRRTSGVRWRGRSLRCSTRRCTRTCAPPCAASARCRTWNSGWQRSARPPEVPPWPVWRPHAPKPRPSCVASATRAGARNSATQQISPPSSPRTPPRTLPPDRTTTDDHRHQHRHSR